MNEQEVKKLYKALIGKGYEKKDIGDESTFAAKMSDEKNRRELYDYVQGRGDFRIGGYEDYERRITGDAAAPQVESGGLSVEGANPGVAAQQVTGYGSQVKGMAALREDAQRFNRAMEQGVEAAKERIGNMREYGSRLGGGQTVESGMRYNPQSGKLERTYLTPTGERTSNKAVAEAASREYRDAADMTVNGQLRRAIRERDEIVRRLAERSRELEEEFNDKSVLEKIAASPLNKLAKPFSAKKVLVKIYYSNAPDIALKIGEMDQLNEFMHNFATDIEVCWSISIDNSLGEKVRITLLSSQLELQLENEFRETYGDEFATGTMNETNNPETETELF